MASPWVLLAAHDGNLIDTCARDQFLDSGPVARMSRKSVIVDAAFAYDAPLVAGGIGWPATERFSHPAIVDCGGRKTRV